MTVRSSPPHCDRAGTRRACAIRAGRFPASPQGRAAQGVRPTPSAPDPDHRRTTAMMSKADTIATTAGVLGRRLAILAQCARVGRSSLPAVSTANRRLPATTTGGATYVAAHAAREHLIERIRPAEPVEVAVFQPLPSNTTARLTGRVLAEVRVNGELHHYRIAQGTFVLLCPPAWLAPDSYDDVRKAGLTAPAGTVAA